jgi:hypothetical protein
MKQTTDQVKVLYKQENWVLDLPSSTTVKGSRSMITSLPSLFESRVTEAVTLLKESVFVNIPGEVSINPILANPTAHAQYGNLVQNLFNAFTQVIICNCI